MSTKVPVVTCWTSDVVLKHLKALGVKASETKHHRLSNDCVQFCVPWSESTNWALKAFLEVLAQAGLTLLKDFGSESTFIECQSCSLQRPQFELKAVLKLALDSGLAVDLTQLLSADIVSVKKIFCRVDQIIPFYELETVLTNAKIPFERKLSEEGIELKITCTIAELETSAKSRK